MTNGGYTTHGWRLLAALVALAACGEEAPSAGEVRMKLTTQVNGITYRLRNATFNVTQGTPPTVVTAVQTEANPGALSVQRTLPAGSYGITLLPGWRLEKLIGATFQPVNTQLVSQNPFAFAIAAGGVTPVAFAFETDGTIVALGDGALTLTISVTDTSTTPATFPAFVAAGAGAATQATTMNVPYPAGVTAGHLLLLQIGTREQNVPTTPAGWTLLTFDQFPNATQHLYYKRATTTEPATLTVTTGASMTNIGRMYAFAGVSTGAGSFVESSVLVTDSDGSPSGPTVAALGPRRLAVAFLALDSNPAMGPFTGETSGDWNEAVPEFTTDLGSNFGIQMQVAAFPAPTLTVSGGQANFGGGSDASLCRAFALIGN
jgi:hypothetical protein